MGEEVDVFLCGGFLPAWIAGTMGAFLWDHARKGASHCGAMSWALSRARVRVGTAGGAVGLDLQFFTIPPEFALDRKGKGLECGCQEGILLNDSTMRADLPRRGRRTEETWWVSYRLAYRISCAQMIPYAMK